MIEITQLGVILRNHLSSVTVHRGTGEKTMHGLGLTICNSGDHFTIIIDSGFEPRRYIVDKDGCIQEEK